MAIILSASTLHGTKIVQPETILEKWPHNKQFPFPMDDQEAWRKWLSYRYTYQGRPLPRTDRSGAHMRYRVYQFGGTPNYTCLFPSKPKVWAKEGYLLPL